MVKTKILFSFIMIALILILVIFLSRKFELNKDQIIIFWILVLFWSAIFSKDVKYSFKFLYFY